MTGIQALERLHPSLPMLPSHVEREEFEDKRHGTQSLIANLDVATGQLVAPSIGPPRDLCRLCRAYHPRLSKRIRKPAGSLSLINSIPINPKRWCAW
jgi:hypothetical protein